MGGGKSPSYPQRQVHLDFHTSPHIPDVGSEFNARDFARTLKRAHVNSINIFAKCHHGMCYYPTKAGVMHPALKGRDLLGEQVEALHREGIKCPIYFTVGWEEDSAHRHVEWRQVRHDGGFARAGRHPGAWWFMNWLHGEYQDLMEAQLREIFKRYNVDGIWFDIVMFEGSSCWSGESVKFRARRGLMAADARTHDLFECAAQAAFAAKFTRLIRGLDRKTEVFYNGTNRLFLDSRVGIRAVARHETQVEIESLPSGFWGYQHFPRVARYVERMGRTWVAMTGRFQRSWGDFGGIKPLAALEYECFRSQALGGANGVGDQLPPRGTLDPAAYELIGKVYTQTEPAEPFYAGSKAWPQAGIFLPSFPGCDHGEADLSLEGAVLFCEEAHYDAAVLDDASPLAGLKLLILPDSVPVSPKLAGRIRKAVAGGARLILSHRSAEGLPVLPLKFAGEAEKWPTYWRIRREFVARSGVANATQNETGDSLCLAGLAGDRVCYQRGMNVRGGKGTRVLADRVLPYFQRDDTHFSSHAQTPPVAKASGWPAVIEGKGFVYFADPLFREYRRSGNIPARDMVKMAAERLVGPPSFGAGLPTTVLVVPRRRGRDLILTLLHYVPVRKSLEIDVIEERMGFGGMELKLNPTPSEVRVFGTGERLMRTRTGFLLPAASGRLMLESRGYFAR